MALPKIVRGKKLLVASVGVAAISYACSSSTTSPSSGNLMAPNDGGSVDSGNDDALISSGNLVAPADSGVVEDSGTEDSGATDAGTD